ncbi:c-Myc-binding protein [Folsomia candida]|uniref:c-Myc-binding protein n=1 Tax=Folsomia candida TaxID=158441 RepID=A0A226D5H6_FOLCA|nr:c-Myc-binding protein [Folsomia candida]OXA40469.1 C-Myc-binding protein [Folsomia candida]
MATNLKPESKRDEFKRYLEKSGVMDSLTKVLVSLYEEPERPGNAVEYFLERLASGVPMKAEMESLQLEINDLRKKSAQLEEENEALKKKLEQFEPSGGSSMSPGGGEEGPSGSEGGVGEE